MQKTVLVTGASTGIGFDAVRALLAEGFRVVATVRKAEDENKLVQLYGERILVICLDVTDFSAVDKLPNILESLHIKELYGLVNNAGIALAGPFVHMDFAEVQSTVQVNVLAMMKVTQVLLPLLGARPGNFNRGRIVNISSISGKAAAPFLTVYAASKFAVEGFSEGLRKEMLLYGIKVIVVAPGSVKTPIWEKGFQGLQDRYNSTDFAESFARFIKIADYEGSNGLEVHVVSRDIVHALKSPNPRLCYLPVPRKWMNWYLPKLIPVRLFDRMTGKVLKLIK